MNKISMFLTAATIAMSALSVHADSDTPTAVEGVTVFETEATVNGVGNWTIADFAGSGKTVTIDFAQGSSTGSDDVIGEIVGLNSEWTSDDDFTVTLTDDNGTVTYTDVYYVYGEENTYVHAYTDSESIEEGVRYNAIFSLIGKKDGTWYNFKVSTRFNKVSDTETLNYDIVPKFKVNNSGDYIYGDTIASKMVTYVDEEGASFYTIPKFLGTEYPYSFRAPEGKTMTCSDRNINNSDKYKYICYKGDMDYVYPITFTYDGVTYTPRGMRYNQSSSTSYLNHYDDNVVNYYSGYALHQGQIAFKGYVDDPTSETEATDESWIYLLLSSGELTNPVGELTSTEDVTLTIATSSGGTAYAQSYATKFITYDNGYYAIEDFYGSGLPLILNFDLPTADGGSTAVTVASLDGDGDFCYLGSYPKMDIISADGDTIAWSYPYYYPGKDYAYVYKYTDDEAYEQNAAYYCELCIKAYENGSSYSSWLYLGFNFGEYVDDGSKMTVYVTDYLGAQSAKNFRTEFVDNEDGTYTMSDFFNSGCPVSFTFDVPAEAGDYSYITFTDYVERDEASGTVDFLDENGDDITCYAYPVGSSSSIALWYPMAYEASSYVERLSDEQAEVYGANGFAEICMIGLLSSGDWSDYYFLDFYFNLPEPDETTGVNALEDNDAPVEYYNLNGVKVANPSAGIYVRKQGNTVEKVVIK